MPYQFGAPITYPRLPNGRLAPPKRWGVVVRLADVLDAEVQFAGTIRDMIQTLQKWRHVKHKGVTLGWTDEDTLNAVEYFLSNWPSVFTARSPILSEFLGDQVRWDDSVTIRASFKALSQAKKRSRGIWIKARHTKKYDKSKNKMQLRVPHR